MAIYETEGIVLHQFDLGEADRIITYYTRDKGKVRAVAKGVRRTRSTMAGSTQLFIYADLIIYRGRGLDRISQSQIKESFDPLRFDLFRMAYGAYILDLVKEITVEEEANEGVFILLLKTLYLVKELDEGYLELVTRIFEIRIMTLMGFRPMLEHCIQCTGPITTTKVHFHPGLGGMLCSECIQKVAGKTVTVNRGTVEIMKRFLQSNYRQLLKLKLPEYARKELEAVLEPFIQFHLDHHLKSLDFLKSVKGMNM